MVFFPSGKKLKLEKWQRERPDEWQEKVEEEIEGLRTSTRMLEVERRILEGMDTWDYWSISQLSMGIAKKIWSSRASYNCNLLFCPNHITLNCKTDHKAGREEGRKLKAIFAPELWHNYHSGKYIYIKYVDTFAYDLLILGCTLALCVFQMGRVSDEQPLK